MEAGAENVSAVIYFSTGKGGNQWEKDSRENVGSLSLRQRMGTTGRKNPACCLKNQKKRSKKIIRQGKLCLFVKIPAKFSQNNLRNDKRMSINQ